jgi:hypothetical protein
VTEPTRAELDEYEGSYFLRMTADGRKIAIHGGPDNLVAEIDYGIQALTAHEKLERARVALGAALHVFELRVTDGKVTTP